MHHSTGSIGKIQPLLCQVRYFYCRLMPAVTDQLHLAGEPPAWTPLLEPVQLQEDAGDYLRDPNAARYPTNPLDPAVWALLVLKPSFPTTEIDIFACGSTLGNLLRFVRQVDKPFRFTIQKVGNAVFFVRRENKHDERIVGVRGYGHSFPERYTRWSSEVKGSASHQRLIKYNFTGLTCMVRFEGDGYLRDLVPGNEEDDEAPPSIPKLTALSMRSGGRPIPQKAMFDLKTRSVKRILDDVLGEELPRLWLTQIPNFILVSRIASTVHPCPLITVLMVTGLPQPRHFPRHPRPRRAQASPRLGEAEPEHTPAICCPFAEAHRPCQELTRWYMRSQMQADRSTRGSYPARRCAGRLV